MRKATGSHRSGDCTRKSSVERRYLIEVVDAGEFRGLSVIGGAKLVANGSRERLENEIRVGDSQIATLYSPSNVFVVCRLRPHAQLLKVIEWRHNDGTMLSNVSGSEDFLRSLLVWATRSGDLRLLEAAVHLRGQTHVYEVSGAPVFDPLGCCWVGRSS